MKITAEVVLTVKVELDLHVPMDRTVAHMHTEAVNQAIKRVGRVIDDRTFFEMVGEPQVKYIIAE